MKERLRIAVLIATSATSGVAGCTVTAPSPSRTAPTAKSTSTCLAYDDDPDTQFPEDWFESLPDEEQSVTSEEAARFAHEVFDLVDRKFYDPSTYVAERRKARLTALQSLSKEGEPTRSVVVAIVRNALRTIGVSHLHLLTPRHARELEERTQAKDKGNELVHVRQAGDVGILTVRSFLVPEISHEAVQEALAKLRPARSILIDLRGNGGGSVSPTIYLSQYFVGPDRVVQSSRDRCGLLRELPSVHRGFLPDEGNEGSAADVAFEEGEGGYVEWRTPADAPAPEPRPTYLLVDGNCGSACEVFAAMMKEHGAARVLGEKTRGAVLSGLAYMPPWRGHLLIVPTGILLSPKGASYEGAGVSPDTTIAQCARTQGEVPSQAGILPKDPCLDAALELVRKETAVIDRKP